MFTVNEDNSIYATRGDIVFFGVTAEDKGQSYTFQPGDVVRIKIYGKKDAENVVLQKDFPVTEATESVEIFLTEADTKIGEVISKATDYWYEVELNPYNNPQTIIGYDEDGAKIFKLFPEGDDIPEYVPTEEEIGTVDTELDMVSTRPVQNQAIARAVVALEASVENNAADNRSLSSEVAVERSRIDNLVSRSVSDDAEVTDARIDYKGRTHTLLGGHLRTVAKELKADIEACSKERVTFDRLEGKVQDVFSKVAYDNGYVTRESTYDSKTKDSASVAGDVAVWINAYITGALIAPTKPFNTVALPSNSAIGAGKLVFMLCRFDSENITKTGKDFTYNIIEQHEFQTNGTNKWVEIPLNKLYDGGKYIALVKRPEDSTTSGGIFSVFCVADDGIYCSDYDTESKRYGLFEIAKNGSRNLVNNVYALPIFVYNHDKGYRYTVNSLMGKSVLFFGDSITAGEPENGNFYVPRLLEKTGMVMVGNYAQWGAKWHHSGTVDGNTVANNTLPNQVMKLLNEVDSGAFEYVPDIVVFSAGTNDHMKDSSEITLRSQFLANTGGYLDVDGVNLNSYIGSMRWCFEKIHDAFPQAQVYFATPIQGEETTRFVEIIEYIADTIKAVASRLACPVIDAFRYSGIYGRYEVKNGNGECLRDGLHPNDHGSELMAECYRLELEKYCKQN